MILVLVETDDSGLLLTSQEALTFARTVAGPDVEGVDVVVVGPRDLVPVVAGLAEHGVRRVHHVDDPRLDAYGGAAWAAAVAEVADVQDARLVLASGTPRGNEVLAHVAARTGSVMAANVVRVAQVDPLTVERQVMGGGILEQMMLPGHPAVLSVAGHAVDPEPAKSRSEPVVEVVPVELSESDLVTRVRRTEARTEGDEAAALTSARVVVGAGRGVGSADGFDDLLDLTGLLGGALGVSRVVTSLGWRPHHEQVGQTGSRIAPEVYLACGISGAIQHWAGCASSQHIIAVNTDEDAPMVTKADHAVIGDLHEVVPAIAAEIRRRAASD